MSSHIARNALVSTKTSTAASITPNTMVEAPSKNVIPNSI